MRYIDADKFIAELEQEKTVALEFEDGVAVYEIEHTMNLIGMQPTADVEPKSESEFDSIPVEVAQFLKDKAVEKVKADVAREIFEDFTKHKVCTNEEDFRVLAELKKKYTEEQT